jgi:predicted SprT family Zn-dependent metalloprotease
VVEIVNMLAVVFSALWVLNTTAKLFRGRKPSAEFRALAALAAELGVKLSVGRHPATYLRHANGAFNPKTNAVWIRYYSCSLLRHELVHALQHTPQGQELITDEAGLRSLLNQHGLRFNPCFVLSFKLFFFVLVVLRVYKPQHYQYELVAHYCQYTSSGKQLLRIFLGS